MKNEKELIDFIVEIYNNCEVNGSIRIKAKKLIDKINSEQLSSNDEKVCNPHHTVSIRWAHKCVDCGKIFEGN